MVVVTKVSLVDDFKDQYLMFSATLIIYHCQCHKMEDRAYNLNIHISRKYMS